MARFRYRMQNILDIKEKLETQARNEFAIATAALAEEESKLQALHDRKTDYENQLRVLYSDKLEVAQIGRTESAIENMKLQIKAQNLQVKQAEHKLELARAKLTEAMQERKTHEKLKEKQFEQFLQDEAASESKMIDELVSFRHGRQGDE